MQNIGEHIVEYVTNLKIRKEYLNTLKSTVANIKNSPGKSKAVGLYGGTFINYFACDKIPWIHVDLGMVGYKNNKANSYGINLLYQFIKQMV